MSMEQGILLDSTRHVIVEENIIGPQRYQDIKIKRSNQILIQRNTLYPPQDYSFSSEVEYSDSIAFLLNDFTNGGDFNVFGTNDLLILGEMDTLELGTFHTTDTMLGVYVFGDANFIEYNSVKNYAIVTRDGFYTDIFFKVTKRIREIRLR